MPKKRKKKARATTIAKNMANWRWSRLYFDPEANKTLYIRVYLIQVTTSSFIFEMRRIYQDESVETALANLKTTSTDRVPDLVKKWLNSRKSTIIPFMDERGKVCKWQQEIYEPSTIPEPIYLIPTSHPEQARPLIGLTLEILVDKIIKRAKNLHRYKKISWRAVEDIDKWARQQKDLNVLKEFYGQLREVE